MVTNRQSASVIAGFNSHFGLLFFWDPTPLRSLRRLNHAPVGDFGLARLMDHELGPLTTGLAGTLGYMAPDFGIVALEIATGVEENFHLGLVKWVWHLYGTQNLSAGVDERLVAGFDEQPIECLMIVGLWCAHPDSSLRPSIRQAIQVLDSDVALPILP
ncbi:L-type lectin-domain containing receptor kinase IX.1-like [Hibiscus syriacus]|uniref:L-type lectin-domain containing receptor kinase IX.1-like n=1 Tax=Hibiscus syriacus TaxID=106335 RepID=UPI001922898D|nr:L-type lectin-domain containing receptor kinase IX.1-like [Hibiscus syriacus]